MNVQQMLKGLAIVFILIIILLIIPKKQSLVEIKSMPVKFTTKQGVLIEKDKIKKTNIDYSNSVVSDKTIYLTFDDGPSFLTEQILDILQEKKVSATFFVIGSKINEYSNLIEREHNEGHTIAIHSDTHNYKYIYSSLDNYLNDFNSIRNKIHNITGTYPRITRLPGGTSNTISKKYKKGIITDITVWLDNNDYYYFDWNIDSLDASGKVSKEVILNSVINNLKTGDNIVLMHDSSTKKTTVEALPIIIDYAKANGYTFARITKNTEKYYHKVKN